MRRVRRHALPGPGQQPQADERRQADRRRPEAARGAGHVVLDIAQPVGPAARQQQRRLQPRGDRRGEAHRRQPESPVARASTRGPSTSSTVARLTPSTSSRGARPRQAAGRAAPGTSAATGRRPPAPARQPARATARGRPSPTSMPSTSSRTLPSTGIAHWHQLNAVAKRSHSVLAVPQPRHLERQHRRRQQGAQRRQQVGQGARGRRHRAASARAPTSGKRDQRRQAGQERLRACRRTARGRRPGRARARTMPSRMLPRVGAGPRRPLMPGTPRGWRDRSRQVAQFGDRHALVGLVHGGADQAELRHRAVARDEARVGGAAAGVELRLDARWRSTIARRSVSTSGPGSVRKRLAADRRRRGRSARRAAPAPRAARPPARRRCGRSLKRMFSSRAPRPGSRWSPCCRRRCW